MHSRSRSTVAARVQRKKRTHHSLIMFSRGEVKVLLAQSQGTNALFDEVPCADEVLVRRLLGWDTVDLLVEALRLAAVRAEALDVAAPRQAVVLRVRDRDDELERLGIDAAVAFLDAHVLRVRVAELVEPGARIEPDRIDDELVALEAADRESVPLRIESVAARQCAAVEPDLAPIVAVLEDLQDPRRRLHDLERRVRRDDLRDEVAHEAERLATSHRVVALHGAARTVARLVRIERRPA